MSNNIGRRITDLRKKNGLSQTSLAKDLRVSRQLISAWEQGTAQPTMKSIVELADIFKVSVDSLVTDGNVIEVVGLTTIPVVSGADELAGSTSEIVMNEGLMMPIEYIVPGELFAFRVTDDSMINTPVFAGDMAFCTRTEKVNDGDIAVISLDGFGLNLRRVQYLSNGLIALMEEKNNAKPVMVPIDEVRICGRVFGVYRKL